MIRKKRKNGDTKSATNGVSSVGKSNKVTRQGSNAVKGKNGWQTYYHEGLDDRAYKMALLGLTDRQIAGVLEVNVNTVDLWKRTKQSFRDAITAGRIEADGKVAEGFYKKATGHYYEEITVLTNKITEYGDDGKPVRSYNEPLLVPVQKYVPPDAWAANKWLSVRQRDHWADTQKVDHRHLVAGSIDLNVDQLMEQIGDGDRFSDEELALAAKMGLDRAKQLTSTNGNGESHE